MSAFWGLQRFCRGALRTTGGFNMLGIMNMMLPRRRGLDHLIPDTLMIALSIAKRVDIVEHAIVAASTRG